MHMVVTHPPFDDLDILAITHLPDDISYPRPDFLRQHLIAILRDPHQVDLEVIYCMRAFAVFFHAPQYTTSRLSTDLRE